MQLAVGNKIYHFLPTANCLLPVASFWCSYAVPDMFSWKEVIRDFDGLKRQEIV